MSEQKPRRRSGPRQTYKRRINGVCVTLYNSKGGEVPEAARRAFEQAALDVAVMYDDLLINIATE